MTRQINVGGVLVGGGAPITVQSMCDTDTRDVCATLSQIKLLAAAGCDIIRVAVPDGEAAGAVREITRQSPIPVVCDIHFDYKLAIKSAENGAAKIRINPGNIGSKERVREVVKVCSERDIPIRIGVNGGSVKRGLIEKHGLREAMLVSAEGQARILEDMGFSAIAFSLKASSVTDTVAVNRAFAERRDYPLHIGITESGTEYRGLIKSSAGIGALLLSGIGDTLRYSLTAAPLKEVRAGVALLKALGLREGGLEIISCPRCARCEIDVLTISELLEARLTDCEKHQKVAVMGCSVNGPGEASEADFGIAPSGNGQVLIFAKGEVIERFPYASHEEILARVMKLLNAGD